MLAQQQLRAPRRRTRPAPTPATPPDNTSARARLMELERLRAMRTEAQAWVRSLEARIGDLEAFVGAPGPPDAA